MKLRSEAAGRVSRRSTDSSSASCRSSSKRSSKRSKRCRRINGRMEGDDFIQNHFYDIGVAVGTERGLVVPVMRDADKKELCRHRARYRGLRGKGARRQNQDRRSAGRHLHHFQRRRLRLASQHADPQSAAKRHPRHAQDPGAPDRGEGQVVVRPMMYLALSYDHRVVDGKEAVTFLVKVKEMHRKPEETAAGFLTAVGMRKSAWKNLMSSSSARDQADM